MDGRRAKTRASERVAIRREGNLVAITTTILCVDEVAAKALCDQVSKQGSPEPAGASAPLYVWPRRA